MYQPRENRSRWADETTMREPAEVLDTTTIQRNDAIRFASLTLENLAFIEDAWRTRQGHAGRPVHLVTQP